MDAMEKIYEVKFMRFTNSMEDTVSSNESDISKEEYIKVGDEPFLIRESEFEKYKRFGGGYRIIRFVGRLITK